VKPSAITTRGDVIAGLTLAVARLESVRAQEALERFHVVERLGRDRLFLTVEDAVRALAPDGGGNVRECN
jgi:hypothetical protein